MEEVWDGSCFVGPRGDEEFATGKEVTEAREGLLPLSEESPAGPAPPSAKALRLDWAFRFHWRRKGCHFAMLSTGLDRLGWDPDKVGGSLVAFTSRRIWHDCPRRSSFGIDQAWGF